MPYPMWAVIILTSIAFMLVAGHMAHTRHRSIKAWVWIAVVVGSFGPLALSILGNRGAHLETSPPSRR
jgi:hypothetical protein